MFLYGILLSKPQELKKYKVYKESPKTFMVYVPESKKAVPLYMIRKATMRNKTMQFYLPEEDS